MLIQFLISLVFDHTGLKRSMAYLGIWRAPDASVGWLVKLNILVTSRIRDHFYIYRTQPTFIEPNVRLYLHENRSSDEMQSMADTSFILPSTVWS